MRRASIGVLASIFFLPGWAYGEAGGATAPTAAPGSRAALEKVVNDYVALYTRDTLDEWGKLLHPALMVFNPGSDGAVRARGLEEFVAAQRDAFASGRRIRERLEKVRIEPGRRIARVSADFIFEEEGESKNGKLGLHLAEGEDGWRVVGILFSYDQP